MTNMLRKSFGAATVSGFWRHWNPIWSYGLSRFVHSPARRYLPASAAGILTFVVSGLLHDAVIMALRGKPALVFTPWFALVALVAIVADATDATLSRLGFAGRAVVHTTVLAVCFWAAFLVSDAFGFWSPD